MKKIIIVLSIIITILCLNKKTIESEETIRFRIIANSDTKEDQQLKKRIIKDISKDIVNYNIKNIEDERSFIKRNLPSIEENIKKNTLDYKISYGNNYFPEKEYQGKKYQEGNYESLVITLGKGTGQNFWCFLFPPLCMIEEDEKTEYKSFIKEVINKYF